MADEEYCSVEDVFRYAVPRGSLTPPARAVSSVYVDADVLELAGHGLELDMPVEFRTFPGGTLPEGLTPLVVYYAQPITGSDSLFRVLDMPAGTVVTLVTEGENFGLVVQIRDTVIAQIRAASQRLHKFLPAHAMPLTPDPVTGKYPETARRMVAVWAAHATNIVLGQRNPLIAEEAQAMFDEAKLLLSGIPARDTGITTGSTNLATGASPTLDDGRARPDGIDSTEWVLP